MCDEHKASQIKFV